MRQYQMLRTEWDLFEDLRSARDELDQMSPILAHALGLHGRRRGATTGSTPARVPALDVSERKDADASEQGFHRVERHHGAFRRSITLPSHVVTDAVQASVDDGVPPIVVPKAEDAKSKRITVRPGHEGNPASSGAAASPG
jgi:hypothetical protein